MLTYDSLLKLDPSFGQGTPEQVADFVYKEYYSDRYEEDTFKREFLAGKGTLQADDLRRIDPSFKEGTDEQLFAFAKDNILGGVKPEQEAEARARFLGPAEERSAGEVVTDTAKGLAGGANRMLSGVAWVAGRALPEGMGEETADNVADTLGEYADRYDASKSEGLRGEQALAAQAREERTLEGQGLLQRGVGAAADYALNPALLGDTLAGSAAYMVPTGAAAKGAGLLRAAQATRAGATAAQAATVARGAAAAAGMVTGGVLEGADAGQSAQDEVRGMRHEDLLANSEDYRQLVEGDGVDQEIAKEMVALSAGRRAFAITAPVAMAAGKLTAGFEADIFMGKGTATSLAGAMLKEPTEEFIQEGSNTFGVNVGVGTTADPSRRYFEGVVEAGAIGAVAGAAQAGAFKGVEYGQDVVTGRLPDKRAARDILTRAKEGSPLSEDEIALARRMFPLDEEVFAKSREARDDADLANPEVALADVENDTTFIEPGQLTQPEGALDPRDVAPAGRQKKLTLEDALARIENAAAPEKGAALTNVEVYDRIMRAAERNDGAMLPEEQAFIERLKSGELQAADPFADGIDRDGLPELVAGAIWRGLQPKPAASPSGLLTRPNEVPVAPLPTPPITPPAAAAAPSIIIPDGARTAAPLPKPPAPAPERTFKTKKEAELAAKQREGAWAPVKKADGKWQLVTQTMPPAPAAPDLLAASTAPAVEPAATAVEPAPAAIAETPAEPSDMQNRDRSRAASVDQMQGIARAPDYDHLAIGGGVDEAAPMVSSKGDLPTVPAAQQGAAQTVVMGDGTKIEARYAVVEADSISASHTADGRVNERYENPQDGDLVALNNGRTAGLQAAYGRGTGADYKAKLAADTRHGVDPAVIEGMKAPVLIRLYADSENTANMGARSNLRSNLDLSDTEQAQTDAKLVQIERLRSSDDGGLRSDANRDFASAFLAALPPQERGSLLTTKGDFAPKFWSRLQAAIFARAYNDGNLIALENESENPRIGAVLTALNMAAADMAALEGLGDLDIRPLLVQAALRVRDARARGLKVSEAVAQVDMVNPPSAEDAQVDALALQLDAFGRSGRKLGEALQHAAKRALTAQHMKDGGDIFGGEPESAADIVAGIKPEKATAEIAKLDTKAKPAPKAEAKAEPEAAMAFEETPAAPAAPAVTPEPVAANEPENNAPAPAQPKEAADNTSTAKSTPAVTPNSAESNSNGGITREQLATIQVDVPVVIEATGETRLVKQAADVALDEVDADIARCKALLKCLGGK